MNQLPDDMFYELLIHMDLKEFVQFCRSNKKYQKFCDDDQYWQRLYQQFSDWFIHDSDKSISINKIRLYIISDHHYNYPNFPPIFQNELTMDWELKLYNIKAVMYKKYIDSAYDYYDYSWFKHEECESKENMCQKYKLN